VQKTAIRPPNSRMGPCTPPERQALMAASPVKGLYDQAEDRESAYEMLQHKAAPEPTPQEPEPRGGGWAGDEASGRPAPQARASNRQGMAEAFAKSMLRTIGSQVGRELIRGVMGGLVASSRPTRRRRY
jgi:hypothetical protein